MIILAVAAMQAGAYDFMAGDIAYNVNADGTTVTVTYTNYGNNYPGKTVIDIPERVTNGGKEYRVTAIGSYALNECSSLTTLKIPATVRSIGEYGVFACERLSTLEMGSNVQEIARYAFSETGLTTLTLPSGVATIGDYAFAGCSHLASVNVGNGVVQIGRSAFKSCTAMTHLQLGTLVETIGVNAFGGNTSLSHISCAMATPPVIQANVFDGVNKGTCLLSVPQGSLALYQTAPVWQDFVNINNGNSGFDITAGDIAYVRSAHKAQLTIGLNNQSEVSALTLTLDLPTGVTIGQTAGSADVWMDSERCTRNHNVMVEGNKILLSSPTGKPLNGNSGSLLYVNLDIDDTLADGHDIWLTGVSVSTPAGQLVNLLDRSVALDIYYLRGDADGDGTVDVADYVVACNKWLGRDVNRYFLDAADVNLNGYLDVADLVGITLRALEKTPVETVKM